MAGESEALGKDYAAAGFGGQLAFGARPALLIVDLVMAYVDPAYPLYARAEGVVGSNERLVAAARAAGVRVIFTNIAYEADGFDGGQFFRKVPGLRVFERGSPQGAFPPTLQPAPGDMVVTKQYPSAFFGTSLASALHTAGVDTLLVTGFSTSGCVRATALDALCHGFAPFVVRDACGDRDPRPHESNLFDMAAKMAEVVDEAEAIRLLQRSASA